MPKTGKEGKCIVVVFASNDLRVHDNYCLSLAVAESVKHYSEHGVYLPIVGVCVLDYRGFAQPSVVGGFYRQSPLRAQFLLDNVRCLRQKLEYQYNIPLLIRCGRPEEHIPRLSVELNAASVYMTTQYAPHERRVQEEMTRQIREGGWIHRQPYVLSLEDYTDKVDDQRDAPSSMNLNDLGFEVEDLVEVVQHTLSEHPYGAEVRRTPARVHTVWQTTLVHLDDLPTPVALMKEGERWYHDDVTAATIRQTALYDKWTDLLRADDFAGVPDAEKYRNRSVEQIRRAEELTALQREWAEAAELMADFRERKGDAPPSLLRGRLPSLQELGYNDIVEHFQFGEVIATQTSHPPGEDEAIRRVHKWLSEGGMTSMLRYGRERRTNTKLYSQKLSRISPYLSLGVLSPRKFYEMIRQHAHDNLRDGFVHMQYREALLRLSRRDYWHWMGLRYGDRLFFSYGPHPEETDNIPNWRHDAKVVQRWCNALTGIPLADAAMRELTGTGFVADVGRQALVWLLVRGYSQDWRLAAEWLERNSLDFDPFICYGCTAYYTDLMKDDFGEPVRNIHYLAHQHDQTGIYIKRWLPQLSKFTPSTSTVPTC
ncbi:deoxyribodipyrimidine photo-lyase [Angomonas deanei]|uniref:DNA photolyase/FAD binding domain of DNA photolyase, putative n=1 Tax=Angomonas deanei TaxID=59799 RepID=A0A7G2CM57_9TRYP|nr:deoxyribodipyrimidine photo-lyase [Angomonas deanei]CAD2220509.1 DNA photolyase/FAD binding domain of DNA photolyase, putative [Angomonas deanei]|eukprot:EPY27245.1 deoxyribodipyrimidine photo-lyase [Angomonas deanei]